MTIDHTSTIYLALKAEFDADPVRSRSHYVAQRIESEYTQSERALYSGTNGQIQATTELAPVLNATGVVLANFPGKLEAHLAEDTLANGAVGRLYLGHTLATLAGSYQAGQFFYDGTSSKLIMQAPPGITVDVGQFVRVRVRGTDRATKGIQHVTQQAGGDLNYCKLTAVVDETPLQAPRSGTLAYQAGVEWSKLAVTGATYTQAAGPAILSDPNVLFRNLAVTGDIVQITTGTYVGYYKVASVGVNSLSLAPLKQTRTSEGVYADGLATIVGTGPCDFTLLGTALDAVFLRDAHATFAGLDNTCWVTTDRVVGLPPSTTYKVSRVPAPGLILLDHTIYGATSAPYTDRGPIVAGTYFTGVQQYSVTRAVAGKLSTFKVTDPSKPWASGILAGDFVTLTLRTGLLDATQNTTAVPGVYKIASVSADTLALDNTHYQAINGTIVAVSGSRFYQNLVDVASWQIDRVGQSFPFVTQNATPTGVSLMYRVVASANNGTPVLLDHVPYGGYDLAAPYHGDFTPLAIAIPAFDDYMDYDLVSVMPDVHVMVLAGKVSGLQEHDYLHVSRTSTPNVEIYRVSSLALKGVAQLDPVLYAGTLVVPATRLEPPYTAGAAAASADEGCHFDVTRPVRVAGNLVLKSLTLAMPTIDQAHVGDWVTVTDTSPDHVGALDGTYPIQGILGVDRVALDFTLARTLEAGLFGESRLGVGTRPNVPGYTDVRATVLRLDTQVTELLFAGPLRAAAITPGTPAAIMDVVTIAHALSTGPFTATYLVLGPYGSAGSGNWRLHPFPLTLAPDGLSYLVGSSRVTAFDRVVGQDIILLNDATYTVLHPTLERRINLDTIAALKDLLTATVTDGLDRDYANVIDPVVTKRDVSTILAILQGGLARLSAIGATAVPVGAAPNTLLAETARLSSVYAADTTLDTLYRDPFFANALPVLLVASFADLTASKTFSELKDLYVDAVLVDKGYAASLLKIQALPANAMPAPAQRQEMAIALIGRVLAAKYLAAVVEAFARVKVNGAAVLAGMRTSLQGLMDVTASLLPATFDFPDRFYVEDTHVDLATNLIPAAYKLYAQQIVLDSATARRNALKAMIAVPSDTSARVKKRSHARAKNRLAYQQAQLKDIARHRDSATDPGIQGVLDGLMGSLSAAIAEQFPQVAALATELGAMGQQASEFANILDPNNEEGLFGGLAAALDAEGSLPDATDLPPIIDALFAPAATVALTLVNPAPDVAAPITLPPFEGTNITNLFENDFQDFRLTGILKPFYSTGNGDAHGGSDRENLSHIYLAGHDGAYVEQFDLGEAGTLSQERYNHFILHSLQESHQEKYQVMDTLSRGWIAFMFGEKPEVWSVSGVLLNDVFSDQATRFRAFYNLYLRGEMLAKRQQKMAIVIPAAGLTVFGYAVGLSLNLDANQNETVVPFTLQFLLESTRANPLLSRATDTEKTLLTKLTGDSGGAVSALQRAASTRVQKKPNATGIVAGLLSDVTGFDPTGKLSAAASLANPAAFGVKVPLLGPLQRDFGIVTPLSPQAITFPSLGP